MTPRWRVMERLEARGYKICPPWVEYMEKFDYVEDALDALPPERDDGTPDAAGAREWFREIFNMTGLEPDGALRSIEVLRMSAVLRAVLT